MNSTITYNADNYTTFDGVTATAVEWEQFLRCLTDTGSPEDLEEDLWGFEFDPELFDRTEDIVWNLMPMFDAMEWATNLTNHLVAKKIAGDICGSVWSQGSGNPDRLVLNAQHDSGIWVGDIYGEIFRACVAKAEEMAAISLPFEIELWDSDDEENPQMKPITIKKKKTTSRSSSPKEKKPDAVLEAEDLEADIEGWIFGGHNTSTRGIVKNIPGNKRALFDSLEEAMVACDEYGGMSVTKIKSGKYQCRTAQEVFPDHREAGSWVWAAGRKNYKLQVGTKCPTTKNNLLDECDQRGGIWEVSHGPEGWTNQI